MDGASGFVSVDSATCCNPSKFEHETLWHTVPVLTPLHHRMHRKIAARLMLHSQSFAFQKWKEVTSEAQGITNSPLPSTSRMAAADDNEHESQSLVYLTQLLRNVEGVQASVDRCKSMLVLNSRHGSNVFSHR